MTPSERIDRLIAGIIVLYPVSPTLGSTLKSPMKLPEKLVSNPRAETVLDERFA